MRHACRIASDGKSDFPRGRGGGESSVGQTPGEALDGLLAQLGASEPISLYIITKDQGDKFFSQMQYERMRELLDRRNREERLSEDEEKELVALVEAEVRAAVLRTSI